MNPTDLIGQPFGTRLRIIRKHVGISARALALRTGDVVTRSMIANYESGRTTSVQQYFVTELASALGVTYWVLADRSRDGEIAGAALKVAEAQAELDAIIWRATD